MFITNIDSNVEFFDENPGTEIFLNQEDAIYSLYEQLFDTREEICKSTIFSAMKYLINEKNMTKQIEEMDHLRKDDLCIVHERQIHKSIQNVTSNIKHDFLHLIEEASY